MCRVPMEEYRKPGNTSSLAKDRLNGRNCVVQYHSYMKF